MSALVLVLAIVLSAALIVPVTVLAAEVVASLSDGHDEPSRSQSVKRLVVVVPAYNESRGIVPTVGDIRSQLRARDRLIVVADNCTDDTAAAATGAGAEVLLRNDLTRVGKGYALAWAISNLETDPPDQVIFVDADCRLAPDSIDGLRAVCDRLGRPVQAGFLMKPAEGSPIDHSFAQFAWIVKNWARPLGLRALGLPVQLMGTGMIFPWHVIKSAPLASGNLVEDLKLGLDLAAAGKPPYFLPSAMVTSEFPLSEKGTASQRQRWIKGHLAMIAVTLPKLLAKAVLQRNFGLFVLALDAAVPPLSLLGLALVAAFMIGAVLALAGVSTVPLIMGTANIVVFAAALAVAWARFGRQAFPLSAALSAGSAIGQRLKLYGRILTGKATGRWERTERAEPNSEPRPD